MYTGRCTENQEKMSVRNGCEPQHPSQNILVLLGIQEKRFVLISKTAAPFTLTSFHK